MPLMPFPRGGMPLRPAAAHPAASDPTIARALMAARPQRASGGSVHVGPLPAAIGGRTDHIPISVPAGSYILPADVVSGMGESNTAKGFQLFNKLFEVTPYTANRYRGARADGGRTPEPVPIMAAGGEYVVPPESVAKIGGGDLKRGHAILDRMVHQVRAKTIRTLKSLPGPKKS